MIRRFFDWSTPFIPTAAQTIVRDALQGATAQAPKELDLGRYAFILSGSRAKRSLEAYVQREAEKAIQAGIATPSWTPPTYLTVGQAPELLYVARKPLAEKIVQLYAQRRALENFLRNDPRAKLLVPTALEGDVNDKAILQLARSFLTLDQELANDRRTYANVAKVCENRGAHEEALRWNALEALNLAYREELEKLGVVDKNVARENALRKHDVGATAFDSYNGEPRLYRVLGAVDLEQQQLDFFTELGERVEFWVYAPKEDAALFDDYGRAIPEAWQNFRANIRDENIFQVETVPQQAEAVALLIKELSKKVNPDGSWEYERVDPEQITIGAPDDSVIPFVEEQTRAIEYETIRAEGEKAERNRVYQLLENVVEYLETRSFASLGELLRRPDLEKYLERKWRFFKLDDVQEESRPKIEESSLEDVERGIQNDAEIARQDEYDTEIDPAPEMETKRGSYRGNWIREYDDYRKRFLPTRVSEKWFKHIDPDSAKRSATYDDLRKAVKIIDAALAGFRNDEMALLARTARNVDDDPQRLSRQELEDAQRAVAAGEIAFGNAGFAEKFSVETNQRRRTIDEWPRILSNLICEIYESNDARARSTDAQIDAFVKLFNNQLTLLASIKSEELITGATAIRMVLAQLSAARIPPLPGSKRVEIQGWLDLLFDDAPYLILTGFNEGSVPTIRATDLFLPNETRRALGMRDSQRVYAHDAYVTRALAESKRAFCVTFSRNSLASEPILPSRFLFAVDPDDAPKRAVRFFSKSASSDLERLRALQENREFPKLRPEEDDSLVASTLGDPELDALRRRAVESAQERERLARAKKAQEIVAPTLNLSGLAPNPTFKVTEFKEFLESPYRYFLNYVFKLTAADSTAPGELDAADYGTLVHNVLRMFGNDKTVANSNNPDIIYSWCSKRLDEIAENSYSDYSSPFVFVQIEQIRERLRYFAEWQAKWRNQGNEIRYVEQAPVGETVILDAGENPPIKIAGRIDRIDYSRATQTWCVFDYKTFELPGKKGGKGNSDSENEGLPKLSQCEGNEVDKRHREKFKRGLTLPEAFCKKYGIKLEGQENENALQYRWTNLQLPLYRLLARQIIHDNNAWRDGDSFKLGYIIISGLETVGSLAPWSEAELQYAEATAKWVAKTIRRLWAQGTLNPNQLIDPEWRELGNVLQKFKGTYEDKFAPVTLSALD